MTIYPIYKNGRVRLIPHVTLLIIEIEGKRVDTFHPTQIERAIEEVDKMAEEDGYYQHVA